MSSRKYAVAVAEVEKRLQADSDVKFRMQLVVDVIWEQLAGTGVSWVGFYLPAASGQELELGSCRDTPACSAISLQGVCGRCWQDRQPQIVEDVRDLGAAYVACDPRDRSEIVLPVYDPGGELLAVLDLDSQQTGSFSEDDLCGLQAVLTAAGLNATLDASEKKVLKLEKEKLSQEEQQTNSQEPLEPPCCGGVDPAEQESDPGCCPQDCPEGQCPETASPEEAFGACCVVELPAISERPWEVGQHKTSIGSVPLIASRLSFADRLGAVKVRLGFGRTKYLVAPGLYAVGQPNDDSPVLVSANYKLSFDHLRGCLSGLNCWVLVIDTKGINVWCAAGKGTFGTDEIVKCVAEAKLEEVVSHRQLILPQLGAPGVAAHQVKKDSGFKVIYGPVRAADIKGFLAAGMQASKEMRRVRFNLLDRAAVVPVEVMHWGRWFLLAAVLLLGLSGLGRDGYAFARLWDQGLRAVLMMFAGFAGGAVLMPLLLPWLPGPAFAVKGAAVGVVLLLLAFLFELLPSATFGARLETISWALLIPSISAFLGMNFTGSSTFTGLSGVKAEMKAALPLEIVCSSLGLLLWIVSCFAKSI
jgi:putative methionine-R-sulfoxide reductase with GAF domain